MIILQVCKQISAATYHSVHVVSFISGSCLSFQIIGIHQSMTAIRVTLMAEIGCFGPCNVSVIQSLVVVTYSSCSQLYGCGNGTDYLIHPM